MTVTAKCSGRFRTSLAHLQAAGLRVPRSLAPLTMVPTEEVTATAGAAPRAVPATRLADRRTVVAAPATPIAAATAAARQAAASDATCGSSDGCGGTCDANCSDGGCTFPSCSGSTPAAWDRMAAAGSATTPATPAASPRPIPSWLDPPRPMCSSSWTSMTMPSSRTRSTPRPRTSSRRQLVSTTGSR